jgi:hypothetical protein
MKFSIRIAFLSLILAACAADPIEDEIVDQPEEKNQAIAIETLFDEQAFPDKNHRKLLLELGICDTVPMEISGCVECGPSNFKFFQHKPNTPISDAFMLQIKAESVLKGQAYGIPERHLLIFERENGSLVKVNGFRGNLIEMRENTASGVRDLIVRFWVAEDEAFLNCLFRWNEGKYQYISVEEIHGGGGNGAVKAEFKDSISRIVYESITSNGLLF